MEVGAERAGDLLPEERVEGHVGDATDDLAQQVPVRVCVVVRLGPRLVPRFRALQDADHLVPVVDLLEPDRAREAGETRAVDEYLTRGDRRLAVLFEPWPVVGDRRVEVEQPTVVQHQHGDVDHHLRRREHVDQRALRPGSSSPAVAGSGPQVDDEIPAEHHGKGGAFVDAEFLIRSEQRPERLESLVAIAVHFTHSDPRSDR